MMDLTSTAAALRDRGIPVLRYEAASELVFHAGERLVITENVFVAPEDDGLAAYIVLSPGEGDDEYVIPCGPHGHVDALEDDVRDALAVMEVYGRMDESREWRAALWLADAPEYLERTPARRAAMERMLRYVLSN